MALKRTGKGLLLFQKLKEFRDPIFDPLTLGNKSNFGIIIFLEFPYLKP